MSRKKGSNNRAITFHVGHGRRAKANGFIQVRDLGRRHRRAGRRRLRSPSVDDVLESVDTVIWMDELQWRCRRHPQRRFDHRIAQLERQKKILIVDDKIFPIRGAPNVKIVLHGLTFRRRASGNRKDT